MKITKEAMKKALFYSMTIKATESTTGSTAAEAVKEFSDNLDQERASLRSLLASDNQEEIKARLEAMLLHAMNN